ncbi:MAG TPA: replicative DNA helicase [Cryomorphaceae bacterium]|nr:replicative DNA helicase [Owenweeksia sp.]HAD96045.1 replicative DNA helicase [Cryomorphaceae bacterium]HCQ14662.1 replicative DNA helicase [Cryomorphaceae bacterium]|tara:strand:+ start:3344 stop:4840 length:1497 start_codon:yes stop_codon:yes gene_type:complete
MADSNKQTVIANQRKKNNIIDLETGRVPPQAVDFEEAVLGAMLIDNSAINQVIDILSPKSFYKEQNQLVFEVIKDLFGNSQPVDILTVSNELRNRGKLADIGGDYYLVNLSQRVSSSAHSEFHARIIVQKHIQREMIRVASDIITKAFDETTDVFDLLDDAEQDLFEVAHGNIVKNYESAQDLIKEAIHRIEEISKKEGLSGVPSGFTRIDRVTAGWQPSDLVILAARPGMGKTAFVLSMARNMSIDHSRPVAVFSLEMSSVQLITRLISSETGLSSEKLRKGNLDDHEWQQLLTKVKSLEKAPLFIDDTPALSVFDLRAKCRRLAAQNNIQLIIIDYLQLMTVGGQGKSNGNREQEISTISRSLKSIAKELNVPVIALSQLSRAVETRGGNKRPLLSDLRESGAIEQDADIVSFIYRPEYYDITEWEDGSPCEGQAEFIIAKHRNGGLENVKLRFQGNLAKFSDLEEDGGFEPIVLESKMNTDSFLDEDDEFDDRPF